MNTNSIKQIVVLILTTLCLNTAFFSIAQSKAGTLESHDDTSTSFTGKNLYTTIQTIYKPLFYSKESTSHTMQPTLISIPPAINLPPGTVTMKVQDNKPTSYFKTILNNIPAGYMVNNSTYVGWCSDPIHYINLNTNYPVTLYSSYNTSLPSHLAHPNWSKVNYILNHKIGTSWQQISYAMYYILDFGDEGLTADGWSMVNNSILYGSNYIPDHGEIIAILADAGTTIQRTLFELTVPQNACYYTLITTVNGSGNITKNPELPYYVYGTNVTLTANPSTGWSFDHWSGDVNGTQNPTIITITSDATVTAHFTQNVYTLTIAVSPVAGGSVSAVPIPPYYYNDVVTLTAVANPGYSFDHWSGDVNGTQNPTTITMIANKSVTAHFTLNQYTLTININGSGSVLKDPDLLTYTYDTLVNLTAIPETGWSFDQWSGDVNGTQNPTSIVMTNDKVVTAHFTQDQYTLDITIVGEGTVVKDPNQPTYTYGTIVELTAVPEDGWSFYQWSGDVTGTTNPVELNMTENKAVTAYFIQNQYTLTVTVDGQGSVIIDPNQTSYLYGTIVELTAVPSTGWNFSHWSGDLNGSINPETIVIDGDKTVTAQFIIEEDIFPPFVTITRPDNAIYLLDNRIAPFMMPLIIQAVTVEVDAIDNESGVDYVEFFVDDVSVANDSEAPYEFIFKDFPSRQHIIRAVAHDYTGNSGSDEITVWKWKFHPGIFIVLIVLGIIYTILSGGSS